MQRLEAAWLAAHLAELPAQDLFPMLNIGSSTAHFRMVRQPWIDALVFAPLRAQGHVVKHLDMKSGEGIDLVGDLMAPTLAESLRSFGFRSVVCSNVLEHVTDRATLC